MKKIIIKDIKGIELKDGDRVWNKNVHAKGRMEYNPNENWWYFYGSDGGRVGVPDYLSSDKRFGVTKLK
jgi:hypothetical protein